MDPISLAALAALAGGVGGEAGRQSLAGLVALVRRPFRRGAGDGEPEPAPAAPGSGSGSGEDELNALVARPDDPDRALALRTALTARAAADPEFARALEEWWDTARQAGGGGEVRNSVANSTVHGPVVQGRDFGNITFGTPPVPPQS